MRRAVLGLGPWIERCHHTISSHVAVVGLKTGSSYSPFHYRA
ncbi:Unknown protein sequence [Pseudomonas coronafaciens pv. oryzae]|nr:Unknown protein sequence [Pseudomonas coronafaciens pv. oryzae]